jgi:glutamate-ammonia-ligase adenylyltransferase
VTSLEAFAQYHGADDQPRPRGGALWERQALLRARPIAGDSTLREKVTASVLDAIARQPAPEETTLLIAEMRYRLDSPGKRGEIHVKKGPGGLLDVEFLTQCLEIRHGLRVPSTRRAIDTLVSAGALDEALGNEIRRHYEFLRRVESRLRLLYWRPDVFVPAEGPGLTRLARQLGDAGADGGVRLRRDLLRTMTRLREIFRAQMA